MRPSSNDTITAVLFDEIFNKISANDIGDRNRGRFSVKWSKFLTAFASYLVHFIVNPPRMVSGGFITSTGIHSVMYLLMFLHCTGSVFFFGNMYWAHDMLSRIFRIWIYELITNISQLKKKPNFVLVKKCNFLSFEHVSKSKQYYISLAVLIFGRKIRSFV